MLFRLICAIHALAAMTFWAAAAAAAPQSAADFRFSSIDGGEIALADWRGRPILVANTASLCAFTPQYDALQALWEAYRDAGLVVLAVPSDDFRQELGSEAEVKEFCSLNFGLDLPMTVITPVRGAGAHPFFRWLEDAHGIAPAWNFHKVLIGPDGQPAGEWGSPVDPASPAVRRAVEAALAD